MSDLIDREKAVDTVVEAMMDGADADMVEGLLYLLPSAEPEIIRCKDCVNSEKWYGDKSRCFLWHEDGIGVFDDGFCNYAERRTDE